MYVIIYYAVCKQRSIYLCNLCLHFLINNFAAAQPKTLLRFKIHQAEGKILKLKLDQFFDCRLMASLAKIITVFKSNTMATRQMIWFHGKNSSKCSKIRTVASAEQKFWGQEAWQFKVNGIFLFPIPTNGGDGEWNGKKNNRIVSSFLSVLTNFFGA